MKNILPLTLCVLLVAACASRPFETRHDDKLLFVPVHIGGNGPYWFCVDSGAPHTVIDPRLVKELGLQTIGRTTTTGAGTGAVAVERAAPLVMSIGSNRLTIAEPWVIDLSGVPIPTWTRGLVGAEWFEAYVIELDVERPSVRLIKPHAFVRPGPAVSLPLENETHRFFMKVTLDVNPELHVERRVRIDTGSGDAVGDEVIRRARQTRETTLGSGLGETYKAVSGLMDAIHVGPFVFRDAWGPATSYPMIGMEIFRRFTTTFDAPHGLIHLTPNRSVGEPVPPPPG